MKRKLKKLKKELERAGGRVYFDPEIPDDVAGMFLDEVMSCPDCARELMRAKTIPPGKGEH
jgi:hypothetical protein